MIYIIPTKRGIGVELWGTYEDLSNLYELIGNFYNDDKQLSKKGFGNRDKLLSGISYEIRKAKEGSRMKRENGHFSLEQQEYLGCQISWVHFLFSLTALKYNMRYYETTKFEISQILLIEFWLEKALKNFDKIGAAKLVNFIEDGLYGANEYIYQYMTSINLDYYMLGGGKTAFRKLPDLLQKGVLFTDEYKAFQKFLVCEAKRLNCEITDLEFNDDDVDYERIKW